MVLLPSHENADGARVIHRHQHDRRERAPPSDERSSLLVHTMRSNDDGASVASSGSTERRSAGSKASAAAGPGGELPMLPVGDPFDLDAGETIQVRLRVLAVPPYLRQDGASPTSGGGKGGKPQVVRRSEVPLEQALHALFEFVGVLLLETTGPGGPGCSTQLTALQSHRLPPRGGIAANDP